MGKCFGLATDVLEEEPGHKDHPYLAFENIVMTPRIGLYYGMLRRDGKQM